MVNSLVFDLDTNNPKAVCSPTTVLVEGGDRLACAVSTVGFGRGQRFEILIDDENVSYSHWAL